MGWDLEERVPLELSLGGERVSIYIDDLLPRLTHLAEYHCDRQTKTAACETLHALVLLLCGRTATSPAPMNDEKTEMYKLWTNLFPVLIRLSVDADKVTRTLFEPLVGQLIRWVCGVNAFHHEASALLELRFDCKRSSELFNRFGVK